MVDIHNHLLYGLDDGPADLATSVALARLAADDGITHVVCTPHASGSFPYDPARIATHADALREELAREQIPLTLGIGCDFHLSYDNIQEALAVPQKYALNGGNYLLVELPDFGLPQTLSDTFYQFQLAGLQPILTHPERNPTLQKDTTRLAEWVRNGLLIQVTAGSVTGRMGKTAQAMAHRLLADRWVHFLATDAHNLTTRPPRLAEARDAVSAKYSASYADLLCTMNPTAAYNGLPLGLQEEPLNLFNEQPTGSNWFKRLLGR